MSIFKSFNTTDHMLGDKKPYWLLSAGIISLAVALSSFYLSYKNFTIICNIFIEKKDFIIINYDIVTASLSFFIWGLFVLWMALSGFSAIFLEKKCFFLILSLPLYVPTKIACYITKVEFNKAIINWNTSEITEKISTLEEKQNKSIKKCKNISIYIVFFSLLIFVSIVAFLDSMPDKTYFEITNAFVTRLSSYHYCYGYKEESPDNSSSKNTESHYKIVYSLKEGILECPLPEEKYQSKMFRKFPSYF